MDGGGYDPEYWLATFGLIGLLRGVGSVYQPLREDDRQLAIWRLCGIGLMVAMSIDMRAEGMAWASVLHFVLKHLGTYHGFRLLGWAVSKGAAAMGWIKPVHGPE